MRGSVNNKTATGVLTVLAAVLLLRAGALVAGELPSKVQAAYLFNFTKFIEWPNAESALTVCVAGADLLGELLNDLAHRPSAGRAIRVLTGRPEDPTACHILYLGQREPRRAELLRQSRGQPVFTVSDAPDFLAEGGIAEFYLDDKGRLRVAIAAAAARAAGLKISGKLLEIAHVVE